MFRLSRLRAVSNSDRKAPYGLLVDNGDFQLDIAPERTLDVRNLESEFNVLSNLRGR